MGFDQYLRDLGGCPNLVEWQLHEISLNRATSVGETLHLAQIISAIYLVFIESNLLLQPFVSLRAQKATMAGSNTHPSDVPLGEAPDVAVRASDSASNIQNLDFFFLVVWDKQ